MEKFVRNPEKSKAEVNCEDLFKWIDSHAITRQKRNLHRDFSDAIPMAEILKYHYPKLVELHNYTSTNSYTNKLVNWQTLNRKVLNKIRISLSNEMMEHLAKGKPGAIEKALSEIKTRIESRGAGDHKDDLFYDTNNSEDNMLRIQKGQKMIPTTLFDKMTRDLQEKDEAINILKQKVEHCENLLKIKDERISDLTRQLENVINGEKKSNVNASSSTGSRFFTRIF